MTSKKFILHAIRDKCIDCACHKVSEIRTCKIMECSLWPYRMGCDPYPARSNRNFKSPSVQEQKFEENTKLMV